MKHIDIFMYSYNMTIKSPQKLLLFELYRQDRFFYHNVHKNSKCCHQQGKLSTHTHGFMYNSRNLKFWRKHWWTHILLEIWGKVLPVINTLQWNTPFNKSAFHTNLSRMRMEKNIRLSMKRTVLYKFFSLRMKRTFVFYVIG